MLTSHNPFADMLLPTKYGKKNTELIFSNCISSSSFYAWRCTKWSRYLTRSPVPTKTVDSSNRLETWANVSSSQNATTNVRASTNSNVRRSMRSNVRQSISRNVRQSTSRSVRPFKSRNVQTCLSRNVPLSTRRNVRRSTSRNVRL